MTLSTPSGPVPAAAPFAGNTVADAARGVARPSRHHQIVIVGGGSAGIATASSLLRRDAGLDIAVVEPASTHAYQPGWTLVGAGVFDLARTMRPQDAVMPEPVEWLRAAVAAFEPDAHRIVLDDGRAVTYDRLVVCTGLELDWNAIPGLADTLGANGVTSNYRADLAPYTWELVNRWRGGQAVFTQPAMPIKCAGAPQKALYLSCDAWRRAGTLTRSEVRFFNAGNALFGVAAFVPALMAYIEAYGVDMRLGQALSAIDGPARQASFVHTGPDGGQETTRVAFDMIHVVPPQVAPAVVRTSPLAGATGWIDVDAATLRHRRWADVFALGDVADTPNAKTMAAARKQAPVVAHNVLVDLGKTRGTATYDGYGACPLTVERGRVVLAEFLYGGRLAPSFPAWLIDGRRPSRAAWFLKEHLLPPLYWDGMLKGREWGARPVVAG